MGNFKKLHKTAAACIASYSSGSSTQGNYFLVAKLATTPSRLSFTSKWSWGA